MRILLTGGGSGGHFYPIIAVAEEINNLIRENRLVKPEMYFMSTNPYNERLLYDNNIIFKKVDSGKIRLSLSLKNIIYNFFDLFNIFFGSLNALWNVYKIYPDVVFGKGGFASFPAVFAARILRIPVVIHESDTIPGKVNKWAGKFARRVAISYPEAAKFFSKDKTAYTGNPIRKEIMEPMKNGGHEYLNLDKNVKTILIIGGSQGSQIINEIIIDSLPRLVSKYQIVHQTGKNNFGVMKETADIVLQNNDNKNRYKPYAYLDLLTEKAAAGACDIVISRAGSSIFEIACWGKPSIIIPIPEETSHDQKTNAYAYARSGAAVVIEEKNLVSNVLISEIERILDNQEEKEKMEAAAKGFARKDSARLIAEEIVNIALEHEK
jgi:UDP-N-acetylglucosamine--N-acetylmuramyl-(pentapeptide) pyrophosphoryl-undecaprenol N-acetylglucosamine transferase